MSTVTTQWVATFSDEVTGPVEGVTEAANEAAEAIDEMGEAANEAAEEIQKISAMDLKAAADAIKDLTNQFEELMEPGQNFEVQMKNVQSITRQTDEEMSRLGDSARALSVQFGGEASAQLESFGAIIGRLGPAMAQDQEALASMGNSVSTLSKLMGNDTVGAMDALTTAMLQFGVDLSDPQVAAAEMARMMNVMAAAGNEGASEVADTSEAIKNAGVLAKQANVSFEETNAALQALAQGGRVGAEAGVSLRNVLGKMGGLDVIPRKAQEKLKELGINYDIVSDKTLPFTTRLQELKKAQGDATLIAQIFGVENAAAANILLDSIGAQQEMTQAISDTNAAYESAEIVMSSQIEQQSRMNAWLNDLKISFFDVAGSITPFVIGLGTVAFTIANIAAAASGIQKFIAFVKDLTIVTHLQTAAQWALNAAQNLSPATWIAAGIMALIAVVIICWNKFEGFRKVVLGVWEVMKGFGNILKNFVIDRIKGLISGIGAIGEAIFKLFDSDFSGAWESAKQGIADLSGYTAVKNAKENFSNMDIAGLYNEGAAKGAASWAADNPKEETIGLSPMQAFQSGQAPTGGTGGAVTGTGTGGKWSKGGTGSDDGVKLSGSGGSGGGKSIVMTVNNYISGFKGSDELANEVAKKINNRLSDGLAVIS
jgi:TP901 family phage tail tape measure protein